ncbi:PREDICTED: dynein heavy chain domain-containing protein 1-like [Branchiostoma belcheri]|uniref:Dynein heavy chain domain-containing protein 1-like n=1 Tax=Branchiostoma belcheri TaxID=7741 RepID=A0A6P4Z8S3_BRABE|nr:PREDICTED: dynein heavy chain domain-containing protein 1-like [Branchiostoma belcheri]
MASIHDEPIMPTVHKLPAINTGRLVSGSGKGSSVHLESASDTWAVQVRRRLQEQVNNGDKPGEELVVQLVQQVVSAFISTLQNDRRPSWLYLCDVLCLLEPHTQLLQGRQQITHYLERVYNHVQTNQERLFDLNIVPALNKVFPKDMERIQHTGGNPRNYRTPTPPRLLSSTPTTSTKRTSVSSSTGLQLPDGSNPYVLERPDDETRYFRPKPLSVGDIRAAIPAVVLEASSRESVWGTSMGITATAMSLDLHDELKPAPPETMSQSLTSIIESKLDEDVSISEEAESISEAPPLTGREAAEMFVKGKHLGKVEFVYLNLTPNRHYRPYDLVVVPKQKINKEHYVFSRFGALHVRPNEPNDTMSIADWNQESVWWSALTCIPFFKHFLVRKAFLRWKSYKRYEDFCRIREDVEENLPLAVPRFGAALLHISRLLLELTAINILPASTNTCFTLPEFETVIKKKRREAEKILSKFFGYSQAVVNQIVSEVFEHLQHCEQQVKQTKTVYTKESLYLQRQKKEQRVQNFKKAKGVASRLGNFVKLVDQILLAHMVSLARTNIGAFVHKTMQAGEEAERDALFKAKLVFNKNDELILYPSKEKFQNATYSALLGIPAVIFRSAHPSEDGASTQGSPGTGSRGRGESSLSSPVKLNVSQESARPQPQPSTGSRRDQSSMQTSRSGAVTGSTSNYTLADPTLERPAMKTKDEDRMGVATPDLVVGAQTPRGLTVGGQGFMGQYSPLSKGSLETKLATDEVVSADVQLHEDMMQSALAEIDSFCIEHVWTKPMHKYAREWSRSVLKTFHGQEAFDIEEKLNEIKNWIERLKDVEKSVRTSDGLFEVDCSVLQQDLVPALSNIFKQLIQLVADDAKNLSSNFVEEIKKLSKTLKDQNTSVDQFAVFAGQVKEYRNRTQQLQEKVSYIKSLYEVIRMSYRSLNPDEEKLEERVRTTWESFLVQLQEAHDFVHTQTPVMLEELDQTYQTLHEEALMISRQATSGQFLDPSKHAPTILVDMRHLAEKFSAVQHKMEEISRWREMITGTGYDLSALEFMVGQMDVRRELWKYVEVATYHIKDWKQQLFRKMNVKKAMGKLTEWQTAAMMMADEVPQGDMVLAHWVNMMQDFKQNLPLLAKLGSDALKHRHWKQLYVGMGKDPSEMGWSMTVGDLIDLDLPKYSQLINQIFTAATSEFSLEQSLGKLRRMWEEKEFKLAKYIRELPVRREKKRTGSPVARLQAAKSRSRTRIVTEETYILIGTDELRYQLEDTEVTLQAMLASPHIADLRSQAEVWRVTLQQVDDIIHLWTECQTKWLFLSKSFADIDLVLQLPDEAAMFSEVDKKYKAFMQDVVEDPKMLSVLSKRRGQKGWRELQGEALRQLLKWCIEEQEKIIKKLDNKLMATRNEFPRLHFLSNSEIVELLSLSRDPRTMTSFVKKCFHGIRALNFALPAEVNHTTTALDLDLHAEVLQATAIKGESGEVVDLVHRVEANTQTTQWLLVVEQTMRNTVGTSLQACLEARLRKTPMTTQTWVRLFPSQCVVLAEAVLWARDVSSALRNSDRQRLMDLKASLSSSLEDRLGILRELYRDQSIRKTHITLGNLVNQAVHQRDIISMLLEAKALTENCFDWQKVMKYSMDIKPVPKSTVHKWRETSHVEDTCEPERIRQALDVRQGFEFGPCLVNQLNWSLPYDYEYLGPVNRLILTPLTDRCLLSLSGSVQSYGCGAVMGPEGVGKSETVAELARAMGRNYITFNCTHQTGISALTQHLVGGVQSGAWVCLDDAGHLSTGVMSVLSHHLDHLRNAYRILAASSDSQYTIRSSQTARKRRKTVTSLASFSPKDPEDSWQAQDTGQHRRHSLFGTDQKEMSSAQSTLPLDLQGFTKSWQATSAFSYEPRTLGLVTYNNSLMNANANFSPFLTLNTRDQSFQTIPETLRSAYRPVTLIVPDRKLVVQSILLCGGFQGHRLLARKLETFLQLLEKQLLSVETPAVSLHTVKVMLALAQQELQTRWLQLSSSGSAERESVLRPNSAEMEEMALVRGVSSTLIPTLQNPGHMALVRGISSTLIPTLQNPDEVSRVKDLLRTAFPVSNRPASAKTNDPVLINAIQEHMEADKLQATPKHLDKILQLWAALQAQQGVMLVGPSGSGKTTTYRVLAEVLNILNENIYASQETPDIYPTPKISKSRLVGSLERRMTQEDMRRKALDDSPDKPRSTKSINRMDLASLPEASYQPEKVDYPRVDGAVLVPNAHSLEDLLGFYDPDDHFWKDGLLTNFLRNALHTAEAAKKMIQNFQSSDRRSKTNLSEPSTVYQWIIMDGRFDPPWSESVVTLLDQNRGIHLTNGDTIALEPTTSLLFEMSELRGASPSLVGRSAIVYFEDGEHIWRSTVESWFLNAFNRWTVTAQTVRVWTDLINDVFPQTIEFLSSNTVSVLDVDTSYSSRARSPCCSGLQEVSSFLSILSSLLNKHMARDPTDANSVRSQSPRDETRSQASWTSAGSQRRMIRLEDLSPSNQAIVSQSMFVFAYIWGFGGHLHERHTAVFDLFARKVLSQASHQILIPPIGSVYDYCIDTKNGTLIRWQERQNAERSRMTLSTYTVLPEVERYSFLIDLLATSQQAVLLAGLPGVGKTALMQNLVQPKHNLTRIAMSSGLSPSELQQVIEFKMDMLTKRTVTARTISSKGKVHNQQVFFIDDINMAANDHCGTQPCLEVLRQIMAHGGVYNIDKHSFKPISNAAFVAACTSPAVAGIGNSAACHQMSRRLIRLFTVIAFHPPSLDSLKKLYTGMLQSWLEEFPVYSVAHHTRMANAIVSACHDLYRQVSARLPPTPQKALHVFSLHDLSRVVQGMLLLTPRVRGKPRPVRTRASSRTWSMVSGDTSTSEGTGKSVSIFPVPPSEDAGDGRTPRRGLSWAGSHSDTPVAPPLQKLVVRLWCHEAIRTFADRLFWDEDVQWFREALTSTVEKHFCTGEEGYDPSRPFVMPAIPETPADQKKSGTPRKYLSPPPRALSAASQEISAVTGEEEGEEDEDLGRETELGTQTSERTTDGDGYETVATDYETDITTPESRMTRATTEYSEYETATTPGTEATTPVSEEEEEEEDDDRETDAETVKTEAEDTLDTDDEATTIKTGFEGTSVIEEDEAESTAKVGCFLFVSE